MLRRPVEHLRNEDWFYIEWARGVPVLYRRYPDWDVYHCVAYGYEKVKQYFLDYLVVEQELCVAEQNN